MATKQTARSRSRSRKLAPADDKGGSTSKVSTSKDATDTEPLHPTVAASDAFMACCAWMAVYRIPSMQSSSYVAGADLVKLGFASFALACSAGVLRFGFNPELFRPYNEVLAKNAGRVGLPLLASAAVAGHFQQWGQPGTVMLLFSLSACSNTWSDKLQLLYTKLLGVLSNACLVVHGARSGDMGSVLGPALFVLGGLVIGSDREKCLFNVRRENWFHYCLGAALLLIGNHVAEK